MKMGCFSVKFEIGPLLGGEPKVKVVGLVDTGAFLPCIPEDLLRQAGIKPVDERDFELADGSVVRLPIGEVRIYFEKFSAPCLVAFSRAGTEPLLGALALESLVLEADPVHQKLRPVKRLPAKMADLAPQPRLSAIASP